jgi:methyl-accepting chemotaxis protein
MSIRTKLIAQSLVTLVGLGLVVVVTILGLNAIRVAEEAAFRRDSYVADLQEIKASALSSIMLDPTLQEAKDVFSAAEMNIDQHAGTAISTIR